jgi:hypothetical protein
MARTKRRQIVVKDAVLEGGSEHSDVRVTFPADLTIDQALQAGIMVGTQLTIHADLDDVYYLELRELGVNWRCVKAAQH